MAQRLAALGVATLHEAQGRTGLMQPGIRPVVAGARVAGPAVTVLVPPGDNWMIHVAIEQCAPGDIVVVACTDDCTDGMVGELIATSMRAHGVAGLILDTGCRDIEALRRMPFAVWSRAVHAQGTVKAALGSVNVPVVCGGALVHPGDAVVADDDGVVVVPHSQIESVAAAGALRVAREDQKRARLAAGELSLDIDGMRARLGELGLRYVDALDDVDAAASANVVTAS